MFASKHLISSLYEGLFFHENWKKEGCTPEDVEFGLTCVCCQGCQTPLPLCEHGGKPFFSAVYPVNEQEIHMSFSRGRDAQTSRKRSSWVHLYFGNCTFCHILVLTTGYVSVFGSKLWGRYLALASTAAVQSFSLDDYLSYRDVWPVLQHTTDT